MMGIYEIRNKENGAIYIGQSFDTAKRMQSHRSALIGDRHANSLLQRDWNAYGGQVFIFKHIETVYHESRLLVREQDWIDEHEEAGLVLYNRAGSSSRKTRGLKKTILYRPIQHCQRVPLIVRYLTFQPKPVVSEEEDTMEDSTDDVTYAWRKVLRDLEQAGDGEGMQAHVEWVKQAGYDLECDCWLSG